MRLPCLFLLGFIPLAFSCKTNSALHKTGVPAYDSLKKYSYLVVGLPHKDTLYSGLRDVSSGFFIKDSNNRLFLVSAYHVLTGCDVLTGKFHDARDDSLQVWYMDTLNHYKFEQFALTAYKNKPCDALIPDVDTIEVTGHFKDGRIFSIERMMPHNLPQDHVAAGDTVICYGYPKKKIPSKPGDKPASPSAAISYMGLNSGHYRDNLDSPIYVVIRPALKSGFSGAPLFRIKAEGNVEFAGIQSSTDDSNRLSLVVRSFELETLLQWK